MSPVELRVTVLDGAFAEPVPMWGDASGGWVPAAVRWHRLLATYGVPVRGIGDPHDDDGGGLLLIVDGALGDARLEGPVLHAPSVPERPLDALRMVRDALGALARPDLSAVLLPRLDDPGSSMRRLLRGWAHPDVAVEAWDALWSAMRGFGLVSVFCCPGWVDADGRVRESRDASPGEWAALDAGIEAGVAELECHGFSHVDPDLGAWLAAPDRFDDEGWYRELRPPRLDAEPSVDAQAAILAAWQARCGPGTTLVAPGEAWGLNTIEAARRRGLRLLCSWEMCRLDLPVPTWTVGIGSPYLDEPDSAHVADGLPVVGYWHDRDMAVDGPQWAPGWFDAWRQCGVRRAWSFRELAAVYAIPPDAVLDGSRVEVRSPSPVPLVVTRRGDAAV